MAEMRSSEAKQAILNEARNTLAGTSDRIDNSADRWQRISDTYHYLADQGCQYGQLAGDFIRNEGFFGKNARDYMEARTRELCNGHELTVNLPHWQEMAQKSLQLLESFIQK